LENLGKKLPNQKAESCPNWPSLYIPLLLAKIFFQDFLSQDFAKKAAFFEAAFFGKSWPNLGKRNLFLNRKMVSC
jgi:hypothetical protein